jgi:hypothetical protein
LRFFYHTFTPLPAPATSKVILSEKLPQKSKMKKIFQVTALLLSLDCPGQPDFGIFAGPQATSANYTVRGVKQETDFKFGFMAGAGLKLPFETQVYFTPAIYYSMKGYKVKFSEFSYPPDEQASDNDTRIHCLELAPLLQLDFTAQPSHLFIKAGPALDFQLFGNEKYNLKTGGSVDRKMPFSFADYGNYSANAILQFGYETVSGLVVFAQYSHGIASINNFDGGPKIRHRVFGISVGKYFKKEKLTIDTRNKE